MELLKQFYSGCLSVIGMTGCLHQYGNLDQCKQMLFYYSFKIFDTYNLFKI